MKFTTFSLTAALTVSSLGNTVLAAWNKTANNNIALYWGQNAVGSYNNNTDVHQKDLLAYCQDPDVDIIPVGFLNVWSSIGGQPEINLSNACTGYQKFPGTDLLWCPSISADIITCQKTYGKKILLSIGGANPSYGGWATEAEAKAFALKVWNMFGKGWSYYRPFGEAIVDGFDLDFEHGPATGYDHFAWQLRQYMTTDTALTGKEWLLTAAPQCMNPDSYLDTAVRNVAFDALFIQFYNNPCQASTWVLGKDQSTNNGFNYAMWDTWAKTKSRNRAIKLFLTLPLSPDAATGYINRDQAWKVIGDLKRYSSFGGFAGWDASIAAQNVGFIPHMKMALNKATIPALPAPVAATTQKQTVKRSAYVHGHHKRHL